MRKITLSILLITIGLFSCKKDISVTSDKVQTFNTNSSELISQTRQLGDERLQRLAYSTYTASEKLEIWKNNLNFYIENGQMSQEQISLVKDLYDKLSESVFEEKKDDAFTAFSLNWITSAMKVFPKSEFKARFMQVSLYQEDTNALNSVEETENCNCKSTNSVFTSCNKCSGLIPLCKRDTKCGFLYLEDCDGRCEDIL